MTGERESLEAGAITDDSGDLSIGAESDDDSGGGSKW